jgi:hypothetical protein
MMKRFVTLGLFENTDGKITCLKVAKRLMTSATSNPQMRTMIQNIKSNQSVEMPSCHRHDDIMPDKIRLDKIRKDKYTPPIPAELLSDYLMVRKAKKAGDLTETAFKGIEREALAAGLTVVQVIQMCCERGWVGFKADWLKTEVKTATTNAWRNDDVAILKKAKELNVHTSGKTKYEILALIDKKQAALVAA